ncbi:PREDICTED: kynurenine formamidase-like [Priapulus caudatus]|uniref:Kynurenine formamidase-like n=1 Tax=Priapulus caudatus TaxID=37621 RepID=A0ABM1FAJ4_PRICU|nr:PREDICTED: kynurenine formamidase-like [Priapulus caudatus]
MDPGLIALIMGTIPESGANYQTNNFCAVEHGGTHIDAPLHFYRGAWAVHDIPVDRMIGDAVVVDVTAKVFGHVDYQATELDLRVWEEKHGRIPVGSILFLFTGWGRYWPDRKKFLGTESRHTTLFEKNIVGIDNVANLDQLPPTGAMVIGLPMKIRGGSGAPLRIIGLFNSLQNYAGIIRG